eukprot:Platyproteum_vivax@DN6468_c0_g1_i1.p1
MPDSECATLLSSSLKNLSHYANARSAVISGARGLVIAATCAACPNVEEITLCLGNINHTLFFEKLTNKVPCLKTLRLSAVVPSDEVLTAMINFVHSCPALKVFELKTTGKSWSFAQTETFLTSLDPTILKKLAVLNFDMEDTVPMGPSTALVVARFIHEFWTLRFWPSLSRLFSQDYVLAVVLNFSSKGPCSKLEQVEFNNGDADMFLMLLQKFRFIRSMVVLNDDRVICKGDEAPRHYRNAGSGLFYAIAEATNLGSLSTIYVSTETYKPSHIESLNEIVRCSHPRLGVVASSIVP